MKNIEERIISIKKLMLIVFIGMMCIGFSIFFQLQISATERYQVTSFDALDQQVYEVENTPEEDLQFPKSLTAQGICLNVKETQEKTTEVVNENSEETEQVLDERTEVVKETPQVVSLTILDVKWYCEEGYDKDIAAEYHFTPIIPSEYSLKEGLQLPIISVNVKNSVASATSSVSDDNQYFLFDQETNTITGYSSSVDAPKDIVIPEKINGVDVLHIGFNAFYKQQLTSVVLNNNLLTIGNSAFNGNPLIKEIIIPNSVTSIGEAIFYNCANLTSITIPNSVTNINRLAFYNPVSSERVIIFEDRNIGSIGDGNWGDEYATFIYKDGIAPPVKYEKDGIVYSPKANSVTGYLGNLEEAIISNGIEVVGRKYPIEKIADSAFKSKTNLVSITIPNSITSIGSSAFSGCSGLTSITIPNSIASIGDSVFSNCSGLTTITIPNSVTSIGNSAFSGCSGLTGITIPNSITSIADSVFSNCSGLTSITIPDSVTSIGNSVFSGCGGLTGIIIPNSITSIGDSVFSNCSGLTTITIPNSVTSIGNSTFSDCSGLTSITIPDSVTSIENSMFSNCSGLTTVIIPNSVTTIGNSVFSNCSRLTTITIPDSVTSIGNNAFYKCSYLKSVIIEGNNAITIDENAFDSSYTFYHNSRSIEFKNRMKGSVENEPWGDNYATIIYKDGTVPPTIVIRDYIHYNIKTKTVVDCDDISRFTKNVAIMSEIEVLGKKYLIESIGDSVFKNCRELTSITISNSITSIKHNAFDGCSSLTTITIPDSVTSMEYGVFWNCSGLRNIIFEGDGDISIANVFSDSYINLYDRIITFKDRNKGSVKNAPWGDLYARIIYKDGEEMPVNVEVDNFVYSRKTKLIVKYIGYESKITIPSKLEIEGEMYPVEGISQGAFDSVKSRLTNITIPNSIKEIKYYTFTEFKKLKEVIIEDGENNVYIESHAFKGCSELTNITIPNSVKKIGGNAFQYCSKLTSIIIPNGMTRIVAYTFLGCSGLTSITIPESVTDIETGAFDGCSGLTNLTIPNSVTRISESAFKGCSGLTSIMIPSSVKELEMYELFNDCSNLSSIVFSEGTIGTNFDVLGNGTFEGCDKLKSITIPSTFTEMGPTMFNNSSIENIYIRQARGSIDSHKYQPWGATTNPKVYYAGEFVDFEHSVEKNIDGGFDISIKASIARKGVLINTITLPDEIGGVVRVGAQQWPSLGVKTFHVDRGGEYTFKGMDTKGIETEYVVSFQSANIVYNANNGDSPQTSTDQEIIGNKYTIRDEYDLGFLKKNAVFKGFNTSANGSGKDYKPGEELDVSGDITLYAQWEDIANNSASFRIRYGDEGLGSISKKIYTGFQDEVLGFNAATVTINPDVEGIKFVGWYKKNQKVDNISEEKLIEESTVYEARFILDINSDGIDDRTLTYPVHFIVREEDKGKASINTKRIDVKYNQTIGMYPPYYLIDEEIAPNVTFDGWYKNGEKVTKLSDEVITDEVTYEARFNGELSRYRMTYIVNDEDGLLNDTETYITQIIEKDGTVNVPSVKANEGKKFMGWYKEDDDKQTLVNAEDIKLECATYVAQIKKVYQIDFKVREEDSRKGSLQPNQTTAVEGTKLEDIMPVVTSQKWSKFIGWYIDNKKVEDISQYTITDHIVVEAGFEVAEGVIIIPGTDGKEDTSDDIIVQPGKKDDKGNILIPDGGMVIYPNGNEEEFPEGGIFIPGADGIIGTDDDVIIKSGTVDDKGNIIIPDGGTIIYPDGSKEELPNGGVITPGADGIIGTDDDAIIKSGTVDDKGNITIPDGGTIIYPDGSKEELPNGGVITPGADGIIGTSDDVIIKSGTVDDKGNITIPDGGTIIYPDGSKEELPNGGVITPGADGIIGTEDDVIIKSGTVDDKGNIIIPDGGTIIYPDGSHKDFPDGGIILPGEDGELGTKDDIIVKPGIIDDNGDIIISDGGVIIYPDGRREEFPNGGTLYAGMDGIFGTNDDLLIRNIKEDSPNTINISTDNQDNNNNKQTIIDNALTSDDTQVLLWSFIGVVSIFGAIVSVKKKLKL